MFANTKNLLNKAQRQRYAVGHFNINNMEIVQGVVAAAEKLKSPIILATSEGAISYAGIDYLYQLASIAAKKNKIPLALHLDHGKDISVIKQAIKIGYSSVMVDASHFPFEKNIQLTKKIVQLAHKKNISVEAELGTIGGQEDAIKSKNIIYTDPDKVAEFVKRTGCDFLAVAIGTSHGAHKFAGKAKLRFDLLQQIKKKVKIPLVLHGASGVPKKLVLQATRYGAKISNVRGISDRQVKKAIKFGITKINTDTDLRLAFDAAVRKFIHKQPKDFDPRHILAPARTSIQKVVEQRIKLFRSVRR